MAAITAAVVRCSFLTEGSWYCRRKAACSGEMELIRKSPRRKGLGQRGLGPVVGCGGKENWYGSQMRLRSKGRKGGKGPESRNPWPGFRGTKKWRSGLEL